MPVRRARPLLRRLRRGRAAARGAHPAGRGGRADPARPGFLAAAADLPARRLPPGLRGEVPRVQRRLAGGHRLHGRPVRGPAERHLAPARGRRVRDLVHADAAGPDRDAAVGVPRASRPAQRPARDAPAGARRRGEQPVRAGVPHHLRGREAGRARGSPRDLGRGRVRRLALARSGRARAPRVPARAARGPPGGRFDCGGPRPARRRSEPVPRARGQQQEAVRAARRPALRPPRGGAGAPRDRRDDPVDARPARGSRRLRRLGRRPARLRLRQPRAPGAEAGVGLRRPRRVARHGDVAVRLGPADRGALGQRRLRRAGVRARPGGDVPYR